jgi:hypothetical protein
MISSNLTILEKGIPVNRDVFTIGNQTIVPLYEDCKRQHRIKNDNHRAVEKLRWIR